MKKVVGIPSLQSTRPSIADTPCCKRSSRRNTHERIRSCVSETNVRYIVMLVL